MKRPVAVDLYAGAGGLSLGLEQAGFDVVLAVDRDPYHVAAHHRNFPNGEVLCASVTDLTAAHVRSVIGPIEIALICGGPPCQGFSMMGKRYAADPRNTLVDDFVRLVIALKPKAFLMENVPGMLAGDFAAVLEGAIERLAKHYRITTPIQKLNAANFGVPQKRERLFVIGARIDLGVEIPYPDGPCAEQAARPTVWEALSDLPSLIGRDDLLKSDVTAYPSSTEDSLHPYVLVARGLRIDPCDLSHPREWRQNECSGCLRINHRADIERLYEATPQGASVPAHNLPKLDPDGLAPTLRAGTDSEHGSYNAPRPVHPYEPRCITVREAARLHGYPDWFKFYPRKWHAHRQIGNSVCPPVARALGTAILRSLQLKTHRPEAPLMLGEDFTLPESEHKHHNRIRQMDEWPKILEHLLKAAQPTKKGQVLRALFSVDDVARAYKATKARMPRTPPDRFLQDIARSRNRHWLLAPARDAGLAILPVSDNGTYGKFVPLGTRGTLEDKDYVVMTSEEIVKAELITAMANARLDDTSLVRYLAHPKVARMLLDAGTFTVDTDSVTIERGRAFIPFKITNGKRTLRNGVVIVVSRGDLPTLSAAETFLRKRGLGTAVIVGKLTKDHFATVLVRILDGRAVERRRGVFKVERPSASAKATA
jgi:DNA (cytosine-5)-methyltransferase 1